MYNTKLNKSKKVYFLHIKIVKKYIYLNLRTDIKKILCSILKYAYKKFFNKG